MSTPDTLAVSRRETPVETVESLCARISAHLDNAARQHKLMVDADTFTEYTSHREGMRVSLYMAGNLQRAVARRLTSAVWS